MVAGCQRNDALRKKGSTDKGLRSALVVLGSNLMHRLCDRVDPRSLACLQSGRIGLIGPSRWSETRELKLGQKITTEE